jgi:hypothetical protein
LHELGIAKVRWVLNWVFDDSSDLGDIEGKLKELAVAEA